MNPVGYLLVLFAWLAAQDPDCVTDQTESESASERQPEPSPNLEADVSASRKEEIADSELGGLTDTEF